MTRRPMYRWKSFWLGVCVLGSLGWAWVRSYSYWEMVMWVSSATGERHSVQQTCGQLGYWKEPDMGIPAGFSFDRTPVEWEAPWFGHWYGSASGEPDGTHFLAHWVVVLVFLIAWGSFLAWRWWRMKRASLTEAEIEAEVSR